MNLKINWEKNPGDIYYGQIGKYALNMQNLQAVKPEEAWSTLDLCLADVLLVP